MNRALLNMRLIRASFFLAAILLVIVPVSKCSKASLSDGFIVSVNRCTASIIGDNWLLTAAHCFENEIYRTHSGAVKTESKDGDAILDLSNSQSRPYKVMKRNSLSLEYEWTRPMEQPQDGINSKTYWR